VLPFLDALNNVVWGPITLWLIGLTGLYLMVGLGFMPLRRIGFCFRQALGSIRSSKGEGDVTAFEGLTTALAATIGTGNVAGVGRRDRHRWPWCGVLDVADRLRGHGHQVRRIRSGRSLPRGG